MSDPEAKEMLSQCFAKENDGISQSYELHRTAYESYKAYVDSITYLDQQNRDMTIMGSNTIAKYLARNAKVLRNFKPDYQESA